MWERAGIGTLVSGRVYALGGQEVNGHRLARIRRARALEN